MNFRNFSLDSFPLDSLGIWPVEETFSLLSPLLPVLNNSVVRQGSAQREILVGGFGDDSLRGDGGNDLLLGLSGDDVLSGEEGNDLIWGGSGNDLIDGGGGRNILWGGSGQDRFILRLDGSTNTLKDYQIGVDQFRFEDGLTFSQLSITQADRDTQIRYLGEPDVAVVLENTQASSLSPNDFVSAAPIPTFDSLFIFGDSLSDTGNLFDLTGFPPFPYADGRFTNGDIWSDYFTDSLAFEPEQVSNFAVGGSTTGDVNALETLIEGLAGVDLTLPGLSNQIDSYLTSLAGNQSDSDGLYVVWAGANDLFNVPDDPADIPGFLTSSINNIAEAISRLAAEGADTFLVPNLPNLGLTPRALSSGNSTQIESLSIAFNTGLAGALETLESKLDIDIVEFDVLSGTADIINFSESFGFTNVTDPLIRQFPPVDSGFFWWDDIHPTTAVHKVLSDAFQAELSNAGYLLDVEETLLSSGGSSGNRVAATGQTQDGALSTALVGKDNISQPDSWDGLGVGNRLLAS